MATLCHRRHFLNHTESFPAVSALILTQSLYSPSCPDGTVYCWVTLPKDSSEHLLLPVPCVMIKLATPTKEEP